MTEWTETGYAVPEVECSSGEELRTLTVRGYSAEDAIKILESLLDKGEASHD